MATGMADVIVVGAGLAGCMAARTLQRAGVKVALLEARDRVGGRTWTRQLGEGMFDVGGQWTGPSQKRMAALIQELGLSTQPTFSEGKKILVLDDRLSTYSGTIPRINPFKLILTQISIWRLEALRKQVRIDAPWESPRAAEFDGQTVQSWMDRHIGNRDVMAMMNAAGRVIFGSDASELSLLHFLFYLNSSGGLMKLIETHGGNQDQFVVGGVQQLCIRMAEEIAQVVLNAPVRRVEWMHSTGGSTEPSQVTLFTDAGEWRARRVIFAVPPALLERILWSPAMPTLRAGLTQRCSMGATAKCFALYKRPFWRDKGLSGESVNTRGPVNVTFDNVSGSQPCLLTFITGAPARGWADKPLETRRALVLNTLARYFGDEALSPTHYEEVDWSSQPWSDGAPIGIFPTGTLSIHGSTLRAPLGPLHWAGTETARESTGFMEGALESGVRAADEVLRAGV